MCSVIIDILLTLSQHVASKATWLFCVFMGIAVISDSSSSVIVMHQILTLLAQIANGECDRLEL